MTSQQTTGTNDRTPFRYTAALANEIETRWQAWWEQDRTYVVPNPGEAGFDASRPKYYVLDMFPYPSGAGLHVGHPEGYTATDILSRYKRMRGFNVLHPMGWDAFGLPAEQHAINTGEHPATFTRGTIDTFRRQLKRFGFCYDWSREFATIDEDYYKWTQWIFIQIYNAWFDTEQDRARPIAELEAMLEQGDARVGPDGDLVRVSDPAKALEELGGEAGLYRHWHELSEPERREFIDSMRLAFVDEQTVNWCPKLGTALANEEVINGRSERGSHPVFRKPLKQWLFRITAYAERLLRGLEDLDWPESTKAQQTDWIGRSEGAEADFNLDIEGSDPDVDADLPPYLRVYTTRPDTLFGATYMVVAPEHPMVDALLASPRPETPTEELRRYAEVARNRTDVERQENKEKTGVFTGVYAINPASGERIPVWTADYVLMGYGHGAIMAVPAHDTRDYEFAKKFGLPIRDVVYDRPHAMMAHFARHAPAELREADRWKDDLADCLGLAVARGAEPCDFGDVLAAVGERRFNKDQDDPKAPVGQRGAIHAEYVAALEAMGLDTFDRFAQVFGEGRFQDAAGEAMSIVGFGVNSANDEVSLDGLETPEAKRIITEWLEAKGLGSPKVNFKLRDWLFSRQRYWGEPFPIVYDEQGNHHAIGEDKLPLILPPLDDYHPDEAEEPRPLLAKAEAWARTTAGEAGVTDLPPDAPVRRETNTMPGWAGSCCYHLRYCDRNNDRTLIGPEADAYWMGTNGVDQYIGGNEHAVLHLLYARFWHMVLHDLGHVRSPEPYRKLFHQGLITSFAYQRKDRSLVPVDEVDEPSEGEFVETATGEAVTQVVAKMSKSLKNVVNPDDIIHDYGADTFRLYEMYMGPLEASKPWNTRDTIGLFRFVQRVWRMAVDEETGELATAETADEDIERLLHRTIAKVGADIERLAFNTAIASMIEFVNAASTSKEKGGAGTGGITRDQLDRFARILAPFTPHVGEELWHRLHGTDAGSIALTEWPTHGEAMLVDDLVEVPVQILGKVRSKIMVPPDADREAMERAALADERIAALLEGKTVRKVIVVPGRLVNIVAG
jgi:leucyl-tRNA synthetase